MTTACEQIARELRQLSAESAETEYRNLRDQLEQEMERGQWDYNDNSRRISLLAVRTGRIEFYAICSEKFSGVELVRTSLGSN